MGSRSPRRFCRADEVFPDRPLDAADEPAITARDRPLSAGRPQWRATMDFFAALFFEIINAVVNGVFSQLLAELLGLFLVA